MADQKPLPGLVRWEMGITPDYRIGVQWLVQWAHLQHPMASQPAGLTALAAERLIADLTQHVKRLRAMDRERSKDSG